MRWRPHSKQLQFLLLLFLPVALALLLGGVFNQFTEQKLQQTRSEYDQAQARDLSSASEASSISLQALVLQQELTDALAQAQSGRIDEAGAYRLHSRIVDQVDQFEQRMARLGQADLTSEPARALRAAQTEFGDFKRFVLMSTDLASIDTRLAGQHLLTAHEHYVKLALQLQSVDERLTQQAQQRNAEAGQALDAIRTRMLMLSGIATGLVLALWLAVAWRLARRLGRLNAALRQLSEHGDGPGDAPMFSELAASARHHGLLGDMTRAVLAYRDARVQRRAAQLALDSERSQLHALIQGMPDLVWLKDPEGAYQVFNQRFLQQTGRSPEALRGMRDQDLFPPDEAAMYLSGDQIAIDTGRYELPPHWRQFSDGHRELVTAIKTPIRDAQGQLLGVLGVGRDITALHQTQQALADRERQYASIVSQAPIGIVLVDLSTLGFISFNDAACQAMGYERDEFARLTIYDLQATLSHEQVDAVVQRIVSENGLAFENQRRNKQGELREFWISMRPLQLDGRTCLTGVWMDVTERKNTERELQRHREQLEQRVIERTASLEEASRRLSEQALQLRSANSELRGIFDHATAGIVILQSRRVLRCNRKVEEIFGYPPGALLNQSTRLWYGSEAEYETAGQLIEHQLDQAGPHVREQEMRRRDGSRFWARLTNARIDIPEFPNAIIGIIEDVTTEHRNAEELRRARDMAESANRAKSSFLANMSHEIRTPMNAIIGLAHLVRRAPLSERQAQQLDKLSDAAMHLLSIINDILDFSKIEAGKMTLDPTDFQLERVVSNVFALVTEKAEAKGLELVAEIGSLPRMLHGDGVRLGQVLLNFANNAVKFTEQGSVRLRGSVLPDRGDGHLWLRFEVRDTGIGISADQQTRLFNAFQQADVSTTRLYGGTGLGLAISRRLADLLGGQVGVSSQPGRGSTFWLEAPFQSAPDSPVHGAMPLPTRSRVLVLDDMEEAREALADLLQGLSARVDRANSGALALEMVAQADAQGDPYLMVFSDWLMPGLNGSQTCERIQQLPLRQQPVCILVSGSSGCPSEVKDDGIFAAFIPKPVLPALLADTISATLVQGRTQQGTVSHQTQGLPRFGPGHRLLLAEDNAMNQEVALELLKDLGFAVDLACDGRQALEQARRQAYELVLMDVQMPVMDGLEATRQIRQLPGWADTPILAMTANAFAEDRAVALAAGMNDHIPKPVDPTLLAQTLARWLPAALQAPDPSDPPSVSSPGPATTPALGDAELRQRLHLVEGLQLDAGLRSMRGDLQRLRNFLLRFAAEHGQDLLKLRDEMQQGEHEASQRRLHTLKGLGGMLGLERVQRLAQAAEQAFKHPSAGALESETAHTEALLQALQQALDESCHSIVLRLGPDSAASTPNNATASQPLPQPTAGSLTQLAEPLAHWLRQLASDDLDAADTFEALRPALQQADPALTRQLAQAMDAFDLAEALALLQRHPDAPRAG